jgi:O-antigen/teichoic acid export membrane protein
MIKSFFKYSLLYSLANLFTRGIGFVLLPIYTRIISKHEYGLFDYLITIGLLLGVVVSLEVAQAIFRFIPEYKEHPLKQIKLASTGFWFSLSMYLLLCSFSFYFSSELANFLLDDDKYSDLIKVTSLLYLSNAVLHYFTVLLRANLLPEKVVIISTLNAVFVAVLSLLLVVYFKLGVLGLIAGQFIGVSLSIFIAFIFVKSWIKLIFCFESLKEMLTFSAPLIFSSIGVVLTMFVDRVMLKEFLGAESLAAYAVAIKIAGIVNLLMVGVQSALTPLVYANYKKVKTPQKIADLFHLYLMASLFSVLILTVMSNWLVLLVAGENYTEASSYVSILVCSALFSSFYLFFPGLSLAKKTFVIASINVFSGLLNVMLNYVLIPKFGAVGAAYSTLFSVFIAASLSIIVAQKHYKIPFHKRYVLCVFVFIGLIIIW